MKKQFLAQFGPPKTEKRGTFHYVVYHSPGEFTQIKISFQPGVMYLCSNGTSLSCANIQMVLFSIQYGGLFYQTIEDKHKKFAILKHYF